MPPKRRAAKTKKPPRVFLVDAHPIVRLGLAELLKRKGFQVCGEAGDSQRALASIRKLKPQAVVVGPAPEDPGGLGLVRALRREAPSAAIIVYTPFDEPVYAERALSLGALGIVGRGEATGRLVEGLRHVLEGKRCLSESLRLAVNGGAERGEWQPGQALRRLSGREFEVLHLIGQGLGTRSVAGRLELSVKTIETYREHLKQKLRLRNAIELVRYATRLCESGMPPRERVA